MGTAYTPYTITKLNENEMTYHQAITLYVAMLQSPDFRALATYHSLPSGPITIYTPLSDDDADKVWRFLREMTEAIGRPR